MEKFQKISKEKQDVIIDAALKVFGRNGYRKSSVSDIASAAGISKAMVFYYFGSKKSMYFYLIDVCAAIITGEIETNLNANVTDFFDRISMIARIKLSAIARHPGIFIFVRGMLSETDQEVEDGVKKLINIDFDEKLRDIFYMRGTDKGKFKDGIDTTLILKFLVWASEGFIYGLPVDADIDAIDVFMEDFYKYVDLMKNNLYKEEYIGIGS